MRAMEGGRQAVGMTRGRPTGARGGADAQRAELVEREDPLRYVFQQVLDAVELGVVVRVGGLLPGAGALEGDAAPGQQAAQGLAAQADRAARDGGQVGGELAQGPVGEGLAQAGRSGGGRLDDEVLFVRAELAGTASRPQRVQSGQADLVEGVDDVAHGVLIGRHELGDHRDPVASSRGQQHHRAAVANGVHRAAPHDLLQLLALLVG